MNHFLVDGYSILHAWDEFRSSRARNLSHARQELIGLLTQFHDLDKRPMTLVFDGRSLPKSGEAIRTSIRVVYSKNHQTADAVIERMVGQSPNPGSYLVATNDMAEQSMVESLGGHTISAEIFHSMVMSDLGDFSKEIKRLGHGSKPFGKRF